MNQTNHFITPLLFLLFNFILFLFCSFTCFAVSDSTSFRPLKINVISEKNGKGLETDQQILSEAITKLGHDVTNLSFEEALWSPADINIFFQLLVSEKFPLARLNWFIPNPEWYRQDIKLLDKVDLILCRTHEIERIFRNLNKQTYYMGFTSPDCYQGDIKKDYYQFFHLAGGSVQKGTIPIKDIWLSHPRLPLLTLIQYPTSFTSQQSNFNWISHRIPLEQLRLFQNQFGIHLCPSETEGFGHYIMEAMSTGAVVVTTDAPPMNEFIKDPRCLVPYTHSAPYYLGINYYVNAQELQNKIKALLKLTPEELSLIGLNNRSAYLQKKQEFYENLEELLWVASFAFEK